MVGPSLSDDETRVARDRLRVGFVLLVGASAALVAVQVGATLAQVGAAFVGGVVVGLALVAFLARWGEEFTASNRR